jgi:cation diffusion facilitator family transporter
METKFDQRFRKIKQLLIFILFLNWAVALAKIIYGLYSHCASMTADGFHSLSDGASNIVGLVGIHFASQPKDQDHPYGHKKFETFFSLFIAAMLFIVAFNLCIEGIKRLSRPVIPEVNLNSFLVMLITLIINVWVMKFEYNKGKLWQSDILVSDSMHTKADILTSLSVIATLVAIKFNLFILDPLACILIAFFIAHAGYEIIKQSSKVLCDAAVIMDLEKIAQIVLKVKGVKTCHKIRTRGRQDDIHVDLHVQVDRDMHMGEAHLISYAIEETLRREIPEITDVVVHMEPKEKKK